MNKKGMIGFLLLAVLLLVSACSSAPEASPSATAAPTTEASAAPAADKPRVIEHAMGTTEITGTPKRVVVLTNDGSDTTIALGIKPVGAVRHWVGNPDWYDFLKADMDGVVMVGEETQPNLEEIAKLQPDLILGSKIRHEKIYEQLKAIAPTVMTETVGTTWKENLILYAKALNLEDKEKQILGDWDKRVADFKSKMGDKLATKVSIVRFQPTEARIYYQGFPGTIIKEVGLDRPDKQKNTDKVVQNLTLEQIPEMDGDVMFYFIASNEEKAKTTYQEWTSNELWKNLSVVKANKVFQVDEVFWNMSGGIQGANHMLNDLYKFFEIQ
ncbi:iron-siderophore ABC transporter substrate-binding protein [Paenibacillus athensensis]|uniref:Fe/B12 periplasmic-binding domain-containing protein n=2 Tax=Paenibacillus athensensis TaxID=1967502 RepID=A0A4Y8Q427_9BACL|nr:iron-siderophore ABC transporter substrate-binding protein [Paenibacillus athensensis]